MGCSSTRRVCGGAHQLGGCVGCSSTMRVCGVRIYYEGVCGAHPKLCNQNTRFISLGGK